MASEDARHGNVIGISCECRVATALALSISSEAQGPCGLQAPLVAAAETLGSLVMRLRARCVHRGPRTAQVVR